MRCFAYITKLNGKMNFKNVPELIFATKLDVDDNENAYNYNY